MKALISKVGSALAVLAPSMIIALPAQAQADAVLEPIGGRGGNHFVARCPEKKYLTGFDLRVGGNVDAIRPLCVSAYAPGQAGAIEPYRFGFGGTGGGDDVRVVCRTDAPVVAAIRVGYEGAQSKIVNNIHLFCGLAAADQHVAKYPAAVFDGPPTTPIGTSNSSRANSYVLSRQDCPPGLVAVGISGRSGTWLDALGLICGPPKLTRAVP
jgi:hypothetical protein